MPRPAKGPRLWFRDERRDDAGRITHHGVWLIRDGDHEQSTGCGAGELGEAEKQFSAYLATKHSKAARVKTKRSADAVPCADVIALYADDVAPRHARPKETAARLGHLLAFFGGNMLSAVNGELCREYVKSRVEAGSTHYAARRELEDFRSAINHHREEGHCGEVVSVVLPDEPPPRDRWLTRSEAAHAILAAWRYREVQKGHPTGRRSRRHVAKFMLVALYTGRRAGAVCEAALGPRADRSWIDLDRGVIHPKPHLRQTNKKQPHRPIPRRLLTHLRRWHRLGQRYPVEFNGAPVKDVDKAFRRNIENAALDAKTTGLDEVTPHILRHTAATWLMQAGTDLWEAAGYLGMSVQTLLDRYGHHHPDYLSGALKAFDQPPLHRHRNGRNKREQSGTNVPKMADYSREGQ